MKKTIILLFILTLSAGLSYYAYKKYDLRFNPVTIGEEAKDFTLPSLDGTPLKLSDYKGKLVLLNFWASWCPPCIKEIPDLIEVQKSFKDKNFTIIGVSVEDKEETLSYAKKAKINYPVTYGEDEGYDVARRSYGMQGIPLNVLISPDQKIIATYYSLTKEELTEIINAQLEK